MAPFPAHQVTNGSVHAANGKKAEARKKKPDTMINKNASSASLSEEREAAFDLVPQAIG